MACMDAIRPMKAYIVLHPFCAHPYNATTPTLSAPQDWSQTHGWMGSSVSCSLQSLCVDLDGVSLQPFTAATKQAQSIPTGLPLSAPHSPVICLSSCRPGCLLGEFVRAVGLHSIKDVAQSKPGVTACAGQQQSKLRSAHMKGRSLQMTLYGSTLHTLGCSNTINVSSDVHNPRERIHVVTHKGTHLCSACELEDSLPGDCPCAACPSSTRIPATAHECK